MWHKFDLESLASGHIQNEWDITTLFTHLSQYIDIKCNVVMIPRISPSSDLNLNDINLPNFKVQYLPFEYYKFPHFH